MERTVNYEPTYQGTPSNSYGSCGMLGGGTGFLTGTLFGWLIGGGRSFGHQDGGYNHCYGTSDTAYITDNVNRNFIATNANINAVNRDVALGTLGLTRDVAGVNERIANQTVWLDNKIDNQTILLNNKIDAFEQRTIVAQKDAEIQRLRDQNFVQSQGAQTIAIEGYLARSGIIPMSSGQVMACHPVATRPEIDAVIQSNSFRQGGIGNTNFSGFSGQGNAGLAG